MSDVLKRSEFFEYMQAFERRLEARFTKIDERFDIVDQRFTKVDEQFESVDKKFQKVDKQFQDVDKQFQNVDEHAKTVKKQLKSIDERFDSLEQTMKVQFEETNRLIRLSLEAVEGLRETTDRGFSEVRSEHVEQTSLLKDAIRHVRGRVERVERRRK